MTTLAWVVVSGAAMSVIALVGSLTLVLRTATLERLLLPLVAFAAGALLGGAFFHMLPEAIAAMGAGLDTFGALLAGFVAFYLLEQYLHWHHCHDVECEHRPVGYLILAADALHNLIGGLAVGAAFTLGVPIGLSTWLAAAAHEVPQELGDFGILATAGWRPRQALLLNLASALTFPLGAVSAFLLSDVLEVSWLVPFAAGNFIYIAGSDLLPQLIEPTSMPRKLENSVALLAGIGLLLLTAAL
ncbi:MAG TPA: ZIP family metal transporter [Candidatus Limnocylindria bacterium]